MSEGRLTVVMSVETVDESLDRRLVEMTDVSSRLTRLLASHLREGGDKSWISASVEVKLTGILSSETTRPRRPQSRETDEHLRVDETESVDDNLPFDRLDGVDNDGDGSRVKLLEGLRTGGRDDEGCIECEVSCWASRWHDMAGRAIMFCLKRSSLRQRRERDEKTLD
jgi:hypothetical protein